MYRHAHISHFRSKFQPRKLLVAGFLSFILICTNGLLTKSLVFIFGDLSPFAHLAQILQCPQPLAGVVRSSAEVPFSQPDPGDPQGHQQNQRKRAPQGQLHEAIFWRRLLLHPGLNLHGESYQPPICPIAIHPSYAEWPEQAIGLQIRAATIET